MPKLENDDLIKQYWESVKDKYPDIPFDKFKKICRTPTDYFKLLIKSDNFVVILVKYLGRITIFPSRIRNMMLRSLVGRRFGRIDQETYLSRINYYWEILKQVEYEFINETEED